MTEQWKDIKDFVGLYKISNLGKVLSIKRNIVLHPELSSNGYLRVGLHKGGKVQNKSIHRLVAEAFIPNPENKPQVNHIDGNKQNNTTSNIEWATSSENIIHRFHTLGQKGVNFGKFGQLNHTSKRVAQIKNDKIIAEYGSVREAGRITGILPSTIHRCISGKYKHAGNYQWKYV